MYYQPLQNNILFAGVSEILDNSENVDPKSDRSVTSNKLK